jgi:hypothetical protein
VQHGDGAEARVELINWRTHAHPEAGRRPQALINRQFADRADIVLAIFWQRLGSRTGKAVSGTVEEIERAQRRGKPVMVYFSQRVGSEKEPLIRANTPSSSGSERNWGETRYMAPTAMCGNLRLLSEKIWRSSWAK